MNESVEDKAEAPPEDEVVMSSREAAFDYSVRHVIRITLTVIASAVLIPIAAFAISRIVNRGDFYTVIAETFTPFVFIPAYGVLVFALLAREKVLAAIAIILIALHIYWIAPDWMPARSLPAAASSAPKITLLSHNIKYDNQTPEDVASSIKRRNADLVFIQELSYRMLNALENENAFEEYPYRYIKPAGGPEGIGMWSKTPLNDRQEIQEGRGLPQLRATTEIAGKKLVLYNVHAHSPMAAPFSAWVGDLDLLRRTLHEETGTVLVAGDFNSTTSHPRYRALISDGYRDEHNDSGRGYARTWPVDHQRYAELGGLIRIDHVLTHGDIRALSIDEDPGRGSDHRAVVTHLALL